MISGKIKFQLDNGFGVVSAGSTELTFKDEQQYEKGETVMVFPHYRRRKLVANVVGLTEGFKAHVAMPSGETHGAIGIFAGEQRIINGYPFSPKGGPIELKDCEVLSSRLVATPNKNYPTGYYRKELVTLRHKPTGIQVEAVLCGETDLHNHGKDREGYARELNFYSTFKFTMYIKYNLEYRKMLEEFVPTVTGDKWADLVRLYKARLKIHQLDYSPNYDASEVERLHNNKEDMKAFGL